MKRIRGAIGGRPSVMQPLLRLSVLTFLLLATAGGGPVDADEGRSIPQIIDAGQPSNERVDPVWVSRDYLLAQPEAFEDSTLIGQKSTLLSISRQNAEIRAKRSLSPSSCPASLGFEFPERDDGRSTESLEAATSSSLAVIIGEIVGKEPGFYLDTPSTLLALGNLEILSNAADLALDKESIYVPFHGADFWIESNSFCASSLYGGKLYKPRLGDRVVVFVLDAPLLNLILAHPWDLVVLPADSREVLLPENMSVRARSASSEAFSNQDQFLTYLRSSSGPRGSGSRR